MQESHFCYLAEWLFCWLREREHFIFFGGAVCERYKDYLIRVVMYNIAYIFTNIVIK